MKQSTIQVGSIVKANPKTSTIIGMYRIRSIRGRFANLSNVFGRSIYHKSVPVKDLIECSEEWYAAWQRTEQYQSM